MLKERIRTRAARAWFVVRAAPGVFVLAFAAGTLATFIWHIWRIEALSDARQRSFAELSVARLRAEPEPAFTPLSELQQPELRGKILRIADLIGTGSTIRGRTLFDCDIYGPAVLLPNPDTVVMRQNIFLGDGGLDGLFLKLDPSQRIADGVIGLEDSRIEGCRLVRIAIAGSRTALDVFRNGFEPAR